jgi:twinkle protein
MIQRLINLVKLRTYTIAKLNKFKFSDRYENMITQNLERKKYFKTSDISMETIFEIFTKCKLYPKYQGQDIRLKYCPVCPNPHNDDQTNLHTCVLYKDNLIYYCFRCGRRGKFQGLMKVLKKQNDLQEYNKIVNSEYSTTDNEDYSLRKRLTTQIVDDSIVNGDDIEFKSNNDPKPQVTVNTNDQTKYKISLNNLGLINEMSKRNYFLNNPKGELIKNYLINKRKLKLKTLEFFRVGVSFEKFKDQSFNFYNLPTVSFPMFYPITPDSVIKVDKDKLDDQTYNHFRCDKFYLSKIKVRAIGKELKHFQRIEPTSAIVWGLFGIDTVPDDAQEIIITEGEYDAMAAYQVYIIIS